MFTGIVEATGKVSGVSKEGTNLRIAVTCAFADELRIDQSISHNGVCLTVVKLFPGGYEVIAVDETLKRSNLDGINEGDEVNLERCTKLGDRLDGHIVQGHVDTVAKVMSVEDQNGSWIINFSYDSAKGVTVEKGSICVNGVSLTVVESLPGQFSTAIIPYTFEHTNFKTLRSGSRVNLEFDIIGKYVKRLMER